MTYLDLINQFWQKDLEFSFTSTEVDVYFRLLDRCNRLGWKSPFNFSADQFMAQLKLRTKKPFDTARKTLRDAGLIEFKNGNGRGCTTEYTIIGAGSEPKPSDKRGKKNIPLSAPLSGRVSGPVSGVVSGLVHKTKTRLDKEEANASGASDEILTKKKGQQIKSRSHRPLIRCAYQPKKVLPPTPLRSPLPRTKTNPSRRCRPTTQPRHALSCRSWPSVGTSASNSTPRAGANSRPLPWPWLPKESWLTYAISSLASTPISVTDSRPIISINSAATTASHRPTHLAPGAAKVTGLPRPKTDASRSPAPSPRLPPEPQHLLPHKKTTGANVHSIQTRTRLPASP